MRQINAIGWAVLCALFVITQAGGAAIIESVDRSNGQSGDREPIVAFDCNTDLSERTYIWVNTQAQVRCVNLVSNEED